MEEELLRETEKRQRAEAKAEGQREKVRELAKEMEEERRIKEERVERAEKQEARYKEKYMEIVKEIGAMSGDNKEVDEGEDVIKKLESIKADLSSLDSLKSQL